MTYFASALTGVALLCVATASPATAGEMPNQYFDGMAAKLIMAGFRDVQMVDEEKNTLAAYDPDGSEVLIVVHPTSRQILRQTFVHTGDY